MMGGVQNLRVERVLRMLKPPERRVALAYADGYADTWEKAAAACGMPPAFGERVRRKLKRKGDELIARQVAAQPRTA